MAVTYVGGASIAMTTSTTSTPALVLPTVQDGDFAIFVFASSGSSTITPPAGLTLVNTNTATAATGQGLLYSKFLSASESGASLVWSSSGGQRMAVSVAVYRGSTTGIGVTGARVETTATDTHLTPTATSPTGGAAVISAFFERSTTLSTAVTQPAGFTLRQSSFGTGTGATGTAIGDSLSTVAAGGSIGGGNWVSTTGAATAGAGTWTIGVVPSTSTALSVTLALSPTSGDAPLSVTATATSTGGTGGGKQHTFIWGDGTANTVQTGNVATHTYTLPGNYTTAAGNPVRVNVVNT